MQEQAITRDQYFQRRQTKIPTRVVVSIILFAVMVILTVFNFYLNRMFFFEWYADAYMYLGRGNLLLSVGLLIFFGGLMYYYLKTPGKGKLIVLGIIMLAWVLNGRTIGIMLYPGGQTSTGWFNVGLHRFYLCNQPANCEDVICSKTKVEKLSFWRLRLKNSGTDEVIFVGPFTWTNTLNMLDESLSSRVRLDD